METHTDSLAKDSSSMAWTLGSRMTALEAAQSSLEAKVSSVQQDTSEIKSMVTEIFQAFKGHYTTTTSVPPATLALTDVPATVEGERVTEASTSQPSTSQPQQQQQQQQQETPSHTEGEEPIHAEPISSYHQDAANKGKAVLTTQEPEPTKQLVQASKEVRLDPEDVKIPYEINGVMYLLTPAQITDYLEKEETLRKVAEEERASKAEMAKVVVEEGKALGLKPQVLQSGAGGALFKKAQDEELRTLNQAREAQLKRASEIRQKKIDRYNWVMTGRYKPEPITDIYIHPNTKPAIVSVYRGSDKRDFEVHSPFRFSEFGISELDELQPLIEKKKNVAKTQLLKSLSQRYQGLARLP